MELSDSFSPAIAVTYTFLSRFQVNPPLLDPLPTLETQLIPISDPYKEKPLIKANPTTSIRKTSSPLLLNAKQKFIKKIDLHRFVIAWIMLRLRLRVIAAATRPPSTCHNNSRTYLGLIEMASIRTFYF
ncbi:hypothetical protein C5167_017210 [Papaver somniferum]|uniref:Uncharacterized protein n=1 Tax=Papaver somniferum TaxID=3469 RepID=A0A4Y7IIT0_PAPSO|nr:hypothetical protein C5167_017210 [Papaver somniferum]